MNGLLRIGEGVPLVFGKIGDRAAAGLRGALGEQ